MPNQKWTYHRGLKMPNINQVALSGELHEQPFMRADGNIEFTLSCARSYRDKETEEWKEEINYITALIHKDNKTAEHASEMMFGTPVLITGRLKSFETADPERIGVMVAVQHLQILTPDDDESAHQTKEE